MTSLAAIHGVATSSVDKSPAGSRMTLRFARWWLIVLLLVTLLRSSHADEHERPAPASAELIAGKDCKVTVR